MKNGIAAALFGGMTLVVFGLIGVVALKDENLLGTSADVRQLRSDLASVRHELTVKSQRVDEQDAALSKLQGTLNQSVKDLLAKGAEVDRTRADLTRCRDRGTDKTLQKSSKAVREE